MLAQEREDLVSLACLGGNDSITFLTEQYIMAEGPFPKKERTTLWSTKAAHIFIKVYTDSGVLREIPAS